ncbi:MAG: SDR family NAD(P)-dependent oxidoreductase, partial [Gammaproteobacteria bacterium]
MGQSTLVITGASRGIGLATAARFAAEGWRVVCVSRSPAPLESAVHLGIDLADPQWDTTHGAALLAAVAGSERICLV